MLRNNKQLYVNLYFHASLSSSGKMNGSGCVFDHYGRVPEGIYKVDSFNSPLEEAVYNRDVEKFKELIKVMHHMYFMLKKIFPNNP